jgi:single-strand DNA-binding protein
VNHVTLIGNLGDNPDVRTTAKGKLVATMRVATTEGRGEAAVTDWHTVVAWDRFAQAALELRKGARVVVVGRLKTRSWEDQRTGQKRFAVEVVASSLAREASTRGLATEEPAPSDPAAPSSAPSSPRDARDEPDYFDDDLPF